MEFYKEGEKSKAVCTNCKEVVPTTFKVQDADIRDGSDILSVPNILVSVCDKCHDFCFFIMGFDCHTAHVICVLSEYFICLH